MLKVKYLASLIFVSLFLTNAGHSEAWVVDYTKSAISFSGKHAGNVFQGTFSVWSTKILFNPDNLEDSIVEVTVNTDTADTDNSLYDGTLKGSDWFDVTNYPVAFFTAESFLKWEQNHYKAPGTLTIKNRSIPIELIFELDISSDNARMTAKHVIDRIQFGLGAQSDPKSDWVSQNIDLQIELYATRN